MLGAEKCFFAATRLCWSGRSSIDAYCFNLQMYSSTRHKMGLNSWTESSKTSPKHVVGFVMDPWSCRIWSSPWKLRFLQRNLSRILYVFLLSSYRNVWNAKDNTTSFTLRQSKIPNWTIHRHFNNDHCGLQPLLPTLEVALVMILQNSQNSLNTATQV